MRNQLGHLIIGLCGSTIQARKDAMEALSDRLPGTIDATIPAVVKAPWRRGDHLSASLATYDWAKHKNIIAIITSREEAEAVERHGGHVIHVEGTPSDEIAIQRHTLLITFAPESRGRYTTISDTLEKLGEEGVTFAQAA